MTLIEEIEALAKSDSWGSGAGIARDLVDTDWWWPRIKAALQAAEAMDEDLDNWGYKNTRSQLKFREANDGVFL